MKKLNDDLGIKDAGTTHPSLSAYFGYCLYKSAMKHRAALNSALAKYDLLGPHLGILCLLKNEGALSQVELGNLLSIDKATMVKLLDGLEKRSWITRASLSSDRRVKKITLNRSGEKHLKELLDIRASVERDFLSVLNKNEVKQLRAIIPKLLKSRKNTFSHDFSS